MIGKLRGAIERADFKPLRATASLGVSATDQAPESFEAMIEQADQALYLSERGGRNRVTAWRASIGAESAP